MHKIVEWPGYVVGRGEDVLDSGACGPCTVVAIVDRNYRSAVVGHFIHPPCDETVFDEMLQAARAAIPDFVEAVVQVAGANPELVLAWSTESETSKVRQFVQRKLLEAGLSAKNITKSWNDSVNHGQILVVDLGLRRLNVETFEI